MILQRNLVSVLFGPFEFPPTKATLQKIRHITPWLEKLNDIQLLELQQAAKSEFILDQLYQMERDNEPYSTSMFTSYATSGKLEDLPTTTRNIRYLFPLLTYYFGMTEQGGCLYDSPVEVWDQILEFAKILSERAEAKKKKDPVPDFDEKFKDFHFKALQAEELAIENIQCAYVMQTKCSCNRGAMGKITQSKIEEIVKVVSHLSSRQPGIKSTD